MSHSHHTPHASRWRRAAHRVAHAVGHQHQLSDRVDAELEASEQGIVAVKRSLGLLLITAVLQAGVVAVSGSVALLADTLHNFADALTAIPLWIAFRLSRRPPDRRFTYGFGRAEDLAGLFVLAMIALSAAFAVVAAIDRLLSPRDIDHLWLVGVAGLIGFVGNEVVARYRMSVGSRIGSAALVADGLHARTDALTSLAVLASVVGVALGVPAVDPIVAILIAVLILKILMDAGAQVLHRLMDGVDEDLVDRTEMTVQSTPFVSGVDWVRLRWVGHQLWAEVDVTVDPQLALRDAHATAHEAEHALFHELPQLASVTVHAHPSADASDDPHTAIDHHRGKRVRPTTDREPQLMPGSTTAARSDEPATSRRDSDVVDAQRGEPQ